MRARLAGILLGMILAAAGSAGESNDPADLIPAAADVPGWTPKGETQRFDGDELFIYIDGGAEIFNEYGFRRVRARDFETKGGLGITLEIYEMADASAAFGIYSFQTSGKGRPADLGTDGEIEDYYLRFWKGPYLVIVTGFAGGEETRPELLDGLLLIARAVDARIAETRDLRPAFLDALPAEWLAPGFKYLRGALGLNNIHSFFPGDVFKFREAVAVPVEDGWLFVFGYRDETEALDRLAEIRQAMKAGGTYRDVRSYPDGRIEAADSRGNRLVARTAGRKIGLAIGPRAEETAGRLLALIR